MARSDFLINFVIGLLLIATLSTGTTFIFLEFSDNYNTDRGSATLENAKVFQETNALVDELTGNVRETGIEDENSDSKIISVGWNSLKLMLKSPKIFSAYMETLSDVIDLSVGGVDFVSLMITVIILVLIFTLILLIFVGRI
jgi:hypothetical protein